MKAWTATLFLGLALILHGCGISGGGSGGPSDKTDDLAIRNVEVVSVTDSSATVGWDTTQDAVSTFFYGENASLLGLTKASALGKTHLAVLEDLQEDTEYHFQIAADDGVGNSVRTDLASLRTELSEDHNDTTAPVISNIQIVGITPTSATIFWDTDDRTTGWIAYGPGLANDQSTPENEFRRSHNLVLSDLSPNTEYDFQIHVSNRANLSGHSAPGTFETESFPTLTIVPDGSTFNIGQEFTFEIQVEGATNVAGLQMMVNYNAAKVKILDFDAGGFFNEGGHIWLLRNSNYFPIDADFTWEITYDEGSAVGSEAPRSGTLAVVRAQAIGETSGSNISFQLLPLNAADGETYDPNNSENATRLLDHHRNPIPVSVRDATIEISAGGNP